jgi:hypothetical protein
MLVHRVPAWLPALTALKDDGEEDLMGADWYQDAIDTAFEGLWPAGPEEGLPWKVSRQLMVLMGDLREGLLLRVYDAEGRRLPTLREAALRADAEQRRAEQRADEERQQADDLARRLAALETRLRAIEGEHRDG